MEQHSMHSEGSPSSTQNRTSSLTWNSQVLLGMASSVRWPVNPSLFLDVGEEGKSKGDDRRMEEGSEPVSILPQGMWLILLSSTRDTAKPLQISTT